ncbi:2-hydroxyglutaryl-CoA dehydratase [Desulfuribacillus stibiiarsenatis]|uniref:2-hydroxyglutaryl-CoA dehydratase n=1 Tax=Desulfuribacillus stibiiarsenatis TaxID=1390249 RepID=A0A1E5L6U6_9FIRM|nr:acyl-CoA dehydratase activase [Desulfuribacillus stibiiarsenatis]OEH85709.1 2-hydroxyglutaryl-CoA dehydratase [Desulfuribacillus stibiiarsenatis]
MNIYLGIDVGSVSTNIVALDELGKVIASLYLRTHGRPIQTVQNGMKLIMKELPEDVTIAGVGTTGSARNLTSIIAGGDVVKNEITAHAVAAQHLIPNVRTVIEIGGQDSKLILLENGIITDFAMNTVCAAGTGSFLDQQAARLGIPIEEFGTYALQSKADVRIAGRCGVFAESDMIHKQQIGCNIDDIIYGLCKALVRNYINNLAKGKKIVGPVIFQGGVAANAGLKKAFEEELGIEIHIPEYFNVMGAIGSAILAKEEVMVTKRTNFRGFELTDRQFATKGFECKDCPNVCEVIETVMDGNVIACWGDKCGKHQNSIKPDYLKA